MLCFVYFWSMTTLSLHKYMDFIKMTKEAGLHEAVLLSGLSTASKFYWMGFLSDFY